MPMPVACIEALRASEKVLGSCLIPINNPTERAAYAAVMARADVPVRTSPTLEVEWLAFNMSIKDVDYSKSPSKVAATWLRKVRQKKVLRERFWNNTWEFYNESRLGLELRSEVPSRKGGHVGSGRGVRKGGDVAMRESMVRSVGAVGNGKATDAGS